MAKDFYEILGVPKSATQDEIKKAFHKLAHQHHPDKSGGNEAKFKEVNEAYQVLSNAEKRKQYDQFGATFGPGGQGQSGFSWQDFAQAQQQGSSFGGGFRTENAQFDFSDLGDLFGDLFGFSSRQRGTRRGQKVSGQDIESVLEVDFLEAVFGGERIINLSKNVVCDHCQGSGSEPGSKSSSCQNCHGRGQITRSQQTIFGSFQSVATCPVCEGEGKIQPKCKSCHGNGLQKKLVTLKVKIPAGINRGQTIRLAGEGEAGERTGPPGDLLLTVEVSSHPRFSRVGDDLYSKEKITFTQAALGAKILLETVDGPVKLKIPPGTQSGRVFRLHGKGVPHLGRLGRGDHLIEIQVVVPSRLTRRQKELLEELKDLE